MKERIKALQSAVNTDSVMKVDFWLLAATLLLAGLGLTMVLSASGVMAERYFDNKYHFFIRHLAFSLIGLTLMSGIILTPVQKIFTMKYAMLGVVLLLLIITMATPLGAQVNGAKRWLKVGPFTVQPMEFAKIALVIYLAWFFSNKKELAKTFSVGVIPPFAVTGALCILVLLQPDFGGAVVLCMLLFLMCLVGGTRMIYLVISLAMATGAGWMLIISSPYRSRRLLAFLDPFKDALDTGYQLVQSLYALGSGRFWGEGLGAGKQKLFFLPEAHNDFIVAVIGEELGFVGVSLVFILFGILLWRAFTIAWSQQLLENRYLAFGVTSILSLGAILNMAVVLGTAPPKGVPMPFLSYGGSSLMLSYACIGVLLNLSSTRVKETVG